MLTTRVAEQVRAALAAVATTSASDVEKVDMLVEVAMGIQATPRRGELEQAVALYRQALEICPATEYTLSARVHARLGTALLALPEEGTASVKQALAEFDVAVKVLRDFGTAEETAELEMNRGLALQTLAAHNEARITDAIAAYQRALRTFGQDAHPKEVAILNNNLATAFLSIPFSDERAKMREALAVQSFEAGLRAVNLVEHPVEYAMLQNNLGNALQYASTSHRLENNVRALDAYEEALKVRTLSAAPLAYANTLANKANCLWNLPDDLEAADSGNAANLRRARACYAEALAIFADHGEAERAGIVTETLAQIDEELSASGGETWS
jgi:tetratricopeptide (TPR) repeat protein